MESKPVKKALRFNQGKIRLELIPPEFIEELGKVFTKGAIKYDDDNWKESVNTEDHDAFVKDRIGSALRHLVKRMSGELYDQETITGAENIQTMHAVMAAWNMLVIAYYDLKKDI